MKFLVLCHILIVFALAKVFEFTVRASPIDATDEEHHGPKTEDDRKEAHEAFYKGEQTIEYPADHSSKNVLPDKNMRWPNARVPYVFHSSVSSNITLILSGMQAITTDTGGCIKFAPRLSEPNYVRFYAGNGCFSMIGMVGKQQDLSLGTGCMYKGTVIHEILHALGLQHEHNRSDRDDYVTIYKQNMKPNMASQFIKVAQHENLLLTPFDYDSVMLYGNTAFSKDRKTLKTIVAKNGVKLYETYEKQGLSASDIKELKSMYNCP